MDPAPLATLERYQAKNVISAFGVQANLAIMLGNAVLVAHNLFFVGSCRN